MSHWNGLIMRALDWPADQFDRLRNWLERGQRDHEIDRLLWRSRRQELEGLLREARRYVESHTSADRHELLKRIDYELLPLKERFTARQTRSRATKTQATK